MPEKFVAEWEKDAKIDPIEIDQSSIDIAKLHSKYIGYYAIASKKLIKLEIELTKLKNDKFKYYSGQLTKHEIDSYGWDYDPFGGNKKPLKSELDKWINSDKDVAAKIEEVEIAKLEKEILKEIVEHIKWRAQNIRNVIDYRKFVSGE